MLTMVTAQNNSAGILYLPLLDSSAGYVVKDIQGLDPGKATMVSSKIAGKDGADFHQASREPRNITMKLGLETNWATNSVAGLRSNLYRYFMPKSALTFALYSDDALFAEIDAIVESFDNSMFSTDPEVDISLLCYDPDFYAPLPTVQTVYTVNDMSTTPITYQGTTETGLIFTVTFPAAATAFKLYNTRPDNIVDIIDVEGAFQSGDTLRINTNPGQKEVTIIRSGLEISALYYLDRLSTWIKLHPGVNQFRAYYSGSPTAGQLTYTAKYGGY